MAASLFAGSSGQPRDVRQPLITKGRPMQYFSFLDDKQVRQVHEASLEILGEVGLVVRNEKAQRRFAEHGATVDFDTGLTRLPAQAGRTLPRHGAADASRCAGGMRALT